MPILSEVGQRISLWLHEVIYSMPSPGNRTLNVGVTPNDDAEDIHARLADLIEERGETKALAGGIGPMSFAGSGYGFMLVITAILLNRIHHIVRRPRIVRPPLPHPPPVNAYSRARAKLAQILVSPETPKYLRIPGIIALFRAWLLFSVLILQVADFWPTDDNSRWLHGTTTGKVVSSFGKWAGGMPMETVCWQVFLSVCAGLVCGGLANGLDRVRRRDVGAGFNLFGYSFLLHLYSSPLTHLRPPPAANHGRPDIHALFQLWLSLTELTWLQTIELWPTLRRNQILPTGVCGVLGLSHFVYALLTSPLRVPSFTFLTHLLALFLLIVITTTFILRGITCLFTYGYIPSPVLSSLLPHEGVRPSLEDDFGVALLKLGTACMEATQYSGLRNELIGIEERVGPSLHLSATSGDVIKPHLARRGGFNAEIIQIEVSRLEDPHSRHVYFAELASFWKSFGNALVNFAWTIILSTPVGRKMVQLVKASWTRRWWYGPREWKFWTRRAWAEPERFRRHRQVRTARQLWEEHVKAARAKSSAMTDPSSSNPNIRRRNTRQTRQNDDDVDDEIRGRLFSMSPTPTPATSVYEDFLRGEVMSDDEDAEEEWEDGVSDSDGTMTVMADDEEVPDDEPELYRDLMLHHTEPSTSTSTSTELQPVLLAHLTSSSASPLTRRQYASIISTASSSRSLTPSRMEEVIQDRRNAMASRDRSDDWEDERRKACIVCMTEPRDTILWPCRCLALCNDCRDSLAARLTPAEHMCPCCRRKVEGFSRIWVP